jgi:hypothetical protein
MSSQLEPPTKVSSVMTLVRHRGFLSSDSAGPMFKNVESVKGPSWTQPRGSEPLPPKDLIICESNSEPLADGLSSVQSQ